MTMSNHSGQQAAGSHAESRPQPFRDPVQFLAFGFGSGLSPWAPGTAGTVVAVVLFGALSLLGVGAYTVLILLTFAIGVAICQRASETLGVHDHPGIVWDEFVGFWIAMWAVPVSWFTVVAGFALFRLFDILKPWPIGWLDRRVSGGLGIMIDDVVAGLMACACLHVLLWSLSDVI